MKRIMHMLHTLDAKVGEEASTVRLGIKWATVEYGDRLALCVCTDRCEGMVGGQIDPVECGVAGSCKNCTICGEGSVEDVWVGRFQDIPARVLRNAHEVRSREYYGLLDSMTKAYGDAFDDDEGKLVTVVEYYRES